MYKRQVLSIVLCTAMLVGSTFAWFTDSVTSGNNKIVAGTLKVGMEWANGTESLETASWKDASQDAIFGADFWEPGYTAARHVRISNNGDLALKYEIRIVANGEVSDLADVIDVYYIKGGRQITDRTELVDENKIGTLAEILANPAVANGHISAKQADEMCIRDRFMTHIWGWDANVDTSVVWGHISNLRKNSGYKGSN